MVLEKNSKIQKTTFFVTDFQNEIKVNYKGILPDLFKEGQGVVVEVILRIIHLTLIMF